VNGFFAGRPTTARRTVESRTKRSAKRTSSKSQITHAKRGSKRNAAITDDLEDNNCPSPFCMPVLLVYDHFILKPHALTGYYNCQQHHQQKQQPYYNNTTTTITILQRYDNNTKMMDIESAMEGFDSTCPPSFIHLPIYKISRSNAT
jgi:hypothetical protein